MSFWNDSLNTIAARWLETLIRACWQGGLALALVWAVCRLLPRLSAAGRCWLWRLAYLKLLCALFWLPTLDLPLLPPHQSAAYHIRCAIFDHAGGDYDGCRQRYGRSAAR